MPVGVEFATEITFPSPESTVAGLLLATSQVLGVTLTIVFEMVHAKYGTYNAILGHVFVLVVGTVTTYFTPNQLRRQAAFNSEVQFQSVAQEE